MNNELGYYADIIGIISGVMSIVGISGVLGWSFFKKGNTPFTKSVLQVFAYSVKAFLCLVFLGFSSFILQFPWMLIVESTGGDSYPRGEWVNGVGYKPIPFYEYLFSHGNLIGSVVIGLFAIPFSIVFCSCILTWSLQPAKDFLNIFTGRTNIE